MLLWISYFVVWFHWVYIFLLFAFRFHGGQCSCCLCFGHVTNDEYWCYWFHVHAVLFRFFFCFFILYINCVHGLTWWSNHWVCWGLSLPTPMTWVRDLRMPHSYFCFLFLLSIYTFFLLMYFSRPYFDRLRIMDELGLTPVCHTFLFLYIFLPFPTFVLFFWHFF